MRTAASLSVLATVALLIGACGDDEKGGAASKRSASSSSSMACMARSIIPPKRYASADDAGIEKGVRPLLTHGFKGGEILTGVLGGVIIEYPTVTEAQRALGKANRSESLGGDVGPPQLFRRTLFIDYSHQGYVARIVRGCGLHPDARPPIP